VIPSGDRGRIHTFRFQGNNPGMNQSNRNERTQSVINERFLLGINENLMCLAGEHRHKSWLYTTSLRISKARLSRRDHTGMSKPLNFKHKTVHAEFITLQY
jgi:hypothetical protein